MDKDRKIRKYHQKDYTNVVDFPVEILGRDGLVRKYSFEESIRLYQRRIASADLRYRDRDIIQAEKQHCLHRIEQLRRSFLAHYGWPDVQLIDDNPDGGPSLSAEVAAFLKRCLGSNVVDAQHLSLSLIETTEHHRVYFLRPPSENVPGDDVCAGHFLLYVFRFETAGGCSSREAFFELIKLMDSIKLAATGSLEHLVAFFHTHDCGLVLTGNGPVSAMVDAEKQVEDLDLSWPDSVEAPDPVHIAMQMMGRGRFAEALELFIQGYTQHHYRRVAYLGAAVVADHLGEDEEAEIATVMGNRYFPRDAALVYHRAVNLLRKRSYSESRACLDQIHHWPNGEGAVHVLRALNFLAEGRVRQGARILRYAEEMNFRMDPHLAKGLRWARSQIWSRNAMLAITMIGAALGTLHMVWLGSVAGGLLALFCVALYRGVRIAWFRQLYRRLHGPRRGRLRLSSSALLMVSRNREVVQ